MNKTTLIRTLHDNVNSATTLSELLYIAKAVEALKIGIVKTVTTYNELLTLTITPVKGDVYFVENEQRLYVNVGIDSWVRITGDTSSTLWSWGGANYGQLGDSTTTSKSSPVSVLGGFTNWIQVVGSDTVAGLRADGSIWTWGANFSNSLGNGDPTTTVSRSSPGSIVGGITDWVKVSGRGRSKIALRNNGSLWGWGANSTGELGDGTTTNRSSPVSVIGGFNDWVDVSMCLGGTIAIRANGTAWAWGSNEFAALGDGTTTTKSSPVSVVGGFTDWVNVAISPANGGGVRSNGTMWGWGQNFSGAIGDGTTIDKSSPVSVVGGFTDWTQLTLGRSFALGLRSNGTIWGWGANGVGQLGTGTSGATNFSSPVSVVGGFTNWVSVSASQAAYHVVGVRSNGTVWAWGNNSRGQLGDGTSLPKSSPVSTVGGFTNWVSAEASTFNTFAIRST